MQSVVAEVESEEHRRAVSISVLDDFLEAQKNSLSRITDGVKKLEELKSQALFDPEYVLKMVTSGPNEGYLKHSEAVRELDTSLPDLEWSLFGRADDAPSTSKAIPGSRSDLIRSQVQDFKKELAALPTLPTNLLGDTESSCRKRKRIEPAPRSVHSSPSTRLGELRPISATLFSNVPVNSLTGSSQQYSKPNNYTVPVVNLNPSSREVITHGLGRDHKENLELPRCWAAKNPVGPVEVGPSDSGSCTGATIFEEQTPSADQQSNHSAPTVQEESPVIVPNVEGELPATFKKTWTVEEQHTLERLLVEIPSTVKFRWVKISEAMGGTRTPRQVASRVQKYYEKMKKLGVTIDSADMGGGGRGGSKATQGLDTPTRKPGSLRQSTRGTPKTGPQYTKSGRRR
ncbi:Myb-like DNA-binding domain protein [Ceratobasidium sp. AG-Ba]|nr:Myb-like DNA-binding domain protein [Ceratobasidium sp. AG-Ba]